MADIAGLPAQLPPLYIRIQCTLGMIVLTQMNNTKEAKLQFFEIYWHCKSMGMQMKALIFSNCKRFHLQHAAGNFKLGFFNRF